MLKCTQCHKTFTRKDSLLRHIKTLHQRTDVRDSSLNDDNEVNDVENKTLSIRDHLLESNYDADDIEKNNINEDVSQVFQDNSEDYIAEKELNPFDQRIRAATEAIKSKFNTLRQSKNSFENGGIHTPVLENQEGVFMKILPKNNNNTAAVFEGKLPELLQCALDILMIKELQNVDIKGKDDEEIVHGENKNAKMKRRFNSVDEQETEDEMKSPEETPLKHLKYDYSIEHENGNDNNLINTECIVKKYWHNPNTLVDELRNLISTTIIGQQISTIIRRLNENNNIKIVNYFEYAKHKEDRNELIRNLKELKETSIGQQIFCILKELENVEIIEPIDNVTDEEKLLNDNDDEEIGIVDDDDDDDDGDVDKSVTAGEGLYIRPYKSLVRV